MSQNTYLDILTKKEFIEDGKKQKHWFKAGNIKVLSNGRMFMVLHQQPDTKFYIFPPNGEESLVTIK